MRNTEVDYGNGLVREFSPEQLRELERRQGVTRESLRDVTRTWAESLPESIDECYAHHFGRGHREVI